MKDIVEIFKDYCTLKGFEYHYGNKNVLNIIDTMPNYTGLIDDLIYFLHEDRKGFIDKANSISSQSLTWSGKFFLVKKSDLNNSFENKYLTNIKPLINVFQQIEKHYSCTEIEIIEFSFIDVTDAFDENMDGILCDYKIKVPNYVK